MTRGSPYRDTFAKVHIWHGTHIASLQQNVCTITPVGLTVPIELLKTK